jgi:hypothetical protein
MRALTICVLTFVLVGSGAAADQQQKLAEGKYAKSIGEQIQQPSQDWALWRTADGGYELVDQFYVANPAASLEAAVGPKYLSPQLRGQLQKEVAQTELDLTLSGDWEAKFLVVKGQRLLDKAPIVLVDCKIQDSKTRCKGANGNAKLNGREIRQFLYSFPFPMLLTPLAIHSAKVPGQSAALKMQVLDFENFGVDGPSLIPADAALTYVGPEPYQAGSTVYSGVGKYTLAVVLSKTTTLKLTFWSSSNGLVLEMRSESIPGESMRLVEFKKYAEF